MFIGRRSNSRDIIYQCCLLWLVAILCAIDDVGFAIDKVNGNEIVDNSTIFSPSLGPSDIKDEDGDDEDSDYIIGDMRFPGAVGEKQLRSIFGNEFTESLIKKQGKKKERPHHHVDQQQRDGNDDADNNDDNDHGNRGLSNVNHNKKRKQSIRRIADAIEQNVYPIPVVYYRLDSTLTTKQIKQVQNAMWEWQSVTCMVFRPVASNDKKTYALNIKNPFPGDDRKFSCSSHVGYFEYYDRYVSISSACSFGSIVHEIGHSLGLLHEQSRNDRDNYVDVEPIDDSMFPGASLSDQYAKISDGGKFTWIGDKTDYDLDSIMHYSGYHQAFDGSIIQIMKPLPPFEDKKLGQRKRSTMNDAAGVNYRQSCIEYPYEGRRARNAPLGQVYYIDPKKDGTRCALFYKYSDADNSCTFVADSTWDEYNPQQTCKGSDKTFGDPKYCTENCPCENGEGTCSKDQHCRFGTYCDTTSGVCKYTLSLDVRTDLPLKCKDFSQSQLKCIWNGCVYDSTRKTDKCISSIQKQLKSQVVSFTPNFVSSHMPYIKSGSMINCAQLNDAPIQWALVGFQLVELKGLQMFYSFRCAEMPRFPPQVTKEIEIQTVNKTTSWVKTTATSITFLGDPKLTIDCKNGFITSIYPEWKYDEPISYDIGNIRFVYSCAQIIRKRVLSATYDVVSQEKCHTETTLTTEPFKIDASIEKGSPSKKPSGVSSLKMSLIRANTFMEFKIFFPECNFGEYLSSVQYVANQSVFYSEDNTDIIGMKFKCCNLVLPSLDVIISDDSFSPTKNPVGPPSKTRKPTLNPVTKVPTSPTLPDQTKCTRKKKKNVCLVGGRKVGQTCCDECPKPCANSLQCRKGYCRRPI